MKLKSNRKLVVLLAIMVLTLSIASTGFAADTIVNLKAQYRNIKILRNGTQVSMPVEPFIVDGTTYVPLRAVSELLDKEITWDGANYKIGINDKPGTNVIELSQKLYAAQITISQLEAKIKDLETKNNSSTSSITTMSAMEKHLNKEYGTYKKVGFDIDLSETKSKITVKVYVDLDEDDSAWNKLKTADITDYLQDIVDDIAASFDQTISGYIEDSYADKKLVTFTVSSKGKVSTSDKSSGSSSDVDDMEEDLDYDYAGKNGIESVEFTESKSKLYLTLYVDKKTWNGLSDSKQESILENMYDDIEEYFSGSITGEIRDDSDNKLLYDFTYSSNGTVSID